MRPAVEEMERMFMKMCNADGKMVMTPRNIEKFRKMQYSEGEYDSMHLVPFMDKCDKETITIDATKYGGCRKAMKITVNKVKGVEDKNRPALIFFHGGAFVFYDAEKTQPSACHHAVSFGMTVFGVDYGVAPEVKAPDGGKNCYASVKYIVENAAKFNIDPSKIVIGGESAGGCHTAMCCHELAKRNESGLVKFAWMDIAAVSDHWLDRTEKNSRDWLEGESAMGNICPLECLVKHTEDFEKSDLTDEDAAFSRMVVNKFRGNPDVFPVHISDEMAKRMPPTLITTREFDLFRRDCEQYGALMRKNKRLLMDVYIQPGTSHMSTMSGDPSIDDGKEMNAVWATCINYFLYDGEPPKPVQAHLEALWEDVAAAVPDTKQDVGIELKDGVEQVQRSDEVADAIAKMIMVSFAGTATSEGELCFDWGLGDVDKALVGNYDDLPRRQAIISWFCKYCVEDAFACGKFGAVLVCRNKDGKIAGAMLLKIYTDKEREPTNAMMKAGGRSGDMSGECKTFCEGPRMTAYDVLLQKLHKQVAPGGHVFMQCVAVDPAEQGKGVGGRLMRAAVAIGEKLGVPCYTETVGKKKTTIFGKYGYKVKAEEKLTVGGEEFELPVVVMLRDK